MARAITGKTRSKSKIKNNELEVLQTQYEVAVDLYKHEDGLNWNKLHNLFYITSALIIILGLSSKSVDNFPDDVDPSMLIFVSLAGILISISFAIAIWSGTFYLGKRKLKVIEIEEMLRKHGGIQIVGDIGKSKTEERDLFDAPTARILKFIPIAVLVGWICLLIYVII